MSNELPLYLQWDSGQTLCFNTETQTVVTEIGSGSISFWLSIFVARIWKHLFK